MRRCFSVRKWLRFPSRAGLLLGLGALSLAGVRADTTAPERTIYSPTMGGLSIRDEGGRIYVSENGGDFREIDLGDTSHARRLAQLLAESGSGDCGSAAALHPVILAGAGGDGFHWTSPSSRNEVGPAAGSRDKRGRPANPSP
jgi:hypothetical protein